MLNKCITEVVGGFWGDEGKGRVASYEARDARLVLRTTGGNNAGHTVYYEGHKLPLHLVPGGIIYPNVTAIICNGVVVDSTVLFDEIKMLQKYIEVTPDNFILSDRAHMIMPYHLNRDKMEETIRGSMSIGTTKRGIGPAYEDQRKRIGIRFQDLFMSEDDLKNKLNMIIDFLKYTPDLSATSYSIEQLYDYCMKAKESIGDYIRNPDSIIAKALEKGDKIVIEGAQADHLDILNGDYPNCTSSECNPAGTISGAGIGPTYINKIIVTAKAYCSRVGNGPFPTELTDEVGDLIREMGHEYGTTTGRPRRCGWLDLAAISPLRGYTDMCLNHVDTIGLIGKKLGYIKVCTGYNYQGKTTRYFPSDTEVTKEVPTPIYKEFKGGWEISHWCDSYEKLPEKALEFINYIEEYLSIPVTYIGIGPKNEDTIIR